MDRRSGLQSICRARFHRQHGLRHAQAHRMRELIESEMRVLSRFHAIPCDVWIEINTIRQHRTKITQFTCFLNTQPLLLGYIASSKTKRNRFQRPPAGSSAGVSRGISRLQAWFGLSESMWVNHVCVRELSPRRSISLAE